MMLLLTIGITAHLTNAAITSAPWFYKKTQRPLAIGHRGSMGHIPESSLESFADIWFSGADWLELDLQVTKDGVIYVNHDECLKPATNAHLFDEEWNDRQRTFYIQHSGHWFEDDYPFPEFTHAEIRANVRRRLRFGTLWRSMDVDDILVIPTLQELVDMMHYLRDNFTQARDRIGVKSLAGLYIEIKEPDWYKESYGIDQGRMLLEFLKENDLDTIEGSTRQKIPIIIQSFTDTALIEFAEWSDLPRVMLIQVQMDYYFYDWEDTAKWAHGVGPATEYIPYWPGNLEDPCQHHVDPSKYSEFVSYMESLDLVVIPYALREEERMYTYTPDQEMAYYANAGCYGLFSEHMSATRTLWDALYPEKYEQDPLFLNIKPSQPTASVHIPMTRGNQRETDRARAAARNAKKPQSNESNSQAEAKKMSQAEIMREKQRRADLKAQGIDPDAKEDQPQKKQYDDSFLNKYQYDYGDEEESKDQVEETKEEVMEDPDKK